MIRKAEVNRQTGETEIRGILVLEGSGRSEIDIPVGFFQHMLESFTRHGCFDLKLKGKGDLHVDQHHFIEDIGLVLGMLFSRALGERKGINRTGFFVFPMDEAMALAAVDLGGRPYLQLDLTLKRRFCGDFDTDLLPEFFQALAVRSCANLVVRVPCGHSDHHKLEAAFKALGKSMRQACSLDIREKDDIPSVKGVIDYDWSD
jgi:imidazoleglycerol-phosphate dehydratase